MVQTIIVKVIKPNSIQRHAINGGSWDDLDTWLLQNIKEPYELIDAETKQPLTARLFDQYASELAEEMTQIIVHVRIRQSPEWAFSEEPPSTKVPEKPKPEDVDLSMKGRLPRLSWKPPKNAGHMKEVKYEVESHKGKVQTTALQIEIDDSPINMACLVSVAAVCDEVVGPKVIKRYVVEKVGQRFEEDARLLRPVCKDFADVRSRSELRVLLVGKQHHGKSSFINHLSRCFQKEMDIGDEFETGPPSEMETTVDMKPISISFENFKFTIYDTPAFSALTGQNCQQLRDLLECSEGGWKRGDSTRASLFPWMTNPPDAVIAIVSLQAWQDEHDELKEYLATLQGVLKHATRNDIAFPYVVVATHKDAFMREAGNNGKDPLEELNLAVKDLQSLANTSKVYPISNYQDTSEWIEENTGDTYRALRDITKFAKHVNTKKTDLTRNSSLQLWLLMAAVAFLVALLAFKR